MQILTQFKLGKRLLLVCRSVLTIALLGYRGTSQSIRIIKLPIFAAPNAHYFIIYVNSFI